MTPAELRRGLEELRDNWNLLRNQVLGRSVTPRPDLPEKVTKMVGEYFNSFRRWYDSIRTDFLSEMFGMYNREFQVQLGRYHEALAVSQKALKDLPTGEKLKAPSMQEFKDTSSMTPWIIAIAALGVAVYFWQRSKQ